MNNSKQILLEIVDEQKKTIEKYSNKLRDVVAAHKSLIKEKKALEDTIKILNEKKTVEDSLQTASASDPDNQSDCSSLVPCSELEEEKLKSQVVSLLNNISNLVEEKSRMEENFRVNHKQLVDDKKVVENKCRDLQEEVNALHKQLKAFENKNPYEFFSRKDSKIQKTTSQSNKLQPERDVTYKNVEADLSHQLKNYEIEVKNLRGELDAKRVVQELSEKKLREYCSELNNLKEEIKNLQLEHQAELQLEKQRARDVENNSKKLAAIQEERVVNLEARLAELSETIGGYDRLRIQDQTEIQKLKDKIAHMDYGQKVNVAENQVPELKSDDYESISKKILKLKRDLKIIAEKHGKEEDFKNMFSTVSNLDSSHSKCTEEFNKLKAEFELYKTKSKVNSTAELQGYKENEVLQNQIRNLQEKIKVLNDRNKNIEKEYQLQVDQLKKTMKNEKAKFKEELEISELDCIGRIWILEEQLQKQRERSLAMLEEKEQEIQSLQNTFHMLLPGTAQKTDSDLGESGNLTGQALDVPHIVYYTNEIARRDVEISNLRKKNYKVEIELRELKKEIVSITEVHKEEKKSLKAEISRLERCQTREGANLEYLKNVVYSFLLSNDPKSKRHMCNAISAVLKFSDSELQKVIDHSKNRWWTNTSFK
ncbi:hypothetical protein RUM43_010704 [Polyplax serrata]|uniref:GRIP domain-containing protein n=1 Tax=Polyplax serrata TaxID=468196 RepID=A0AAN8SA13_POLSC